MSYKGVLDEFDEFGVSAQKGLLEEMNDLNLIDQPGERWCVCVFVCCT